MPDEVNIDLHVYDKNVQGCKRHGKHIMVSYYSEAQGGFVDLFLTQLQAMKLVEDLKSRIDINNDEIGDPAERKVLIEKILKDGFAD